MNCFEFFVETKRFARLTRISVIIPSDTFVEKLKSIYFQRNYTILWYLTFFLIPSSSHEDVLRISITPATFHYATCNMNSCPPCSQLSDYIFPRFRMVKCIFLVYRLFIVLFLFLCLLIFCSPWFCEKTKIL